MLFRYFGQQAAWERKGFRFKMPIKLLDSTMVSVTISVYDWAHYTTSKGAVKMHTLLDYDCLLPEFMNITGGKRTDNKAAFDIEIKPHSIVVADRGYCDYGLLNHWDSNNVFYVVRHCAVPVRSTARPMRPFWAARFLLPVQRETSRRRCSGSAALSRER